MIYADLHSHTAYSDGLLPISEVLQLAKDNGIDTIAISEHDITYHFEDVKRAADTIGINVVKGVEMSCYDFEQNKKVHVLGLFLNEDSAKVEALCNKTLQGRNDYHKELIQVLNNQGYEITFEDAQKFSQYSGIVFKMNLFQALKEKYPEEMTEARYKELFASETSVETDRKMNYTPVKEGIQAIIHDGGIPILAHPCVYDNYDEIDKYAEFGLMGIEIDHSRMKAIDYELTDQFATKHNFIRSGGSDFHNPATIKFGVNGLTEVQFRELLERVEKYKKTR